MNYVKYLIIDRMIYLEEMYAKLFSHVDNHC